MVCYEYIKHRLRIKRVTQIFGVLVLSTILVGCGSGGSSSGGGSATNTQALTKILTIGDSIGTGYGVATPWPVRLQSALGVPLFNNSRSSRMTSEGLALIEPLLVSETPSHVVIMLGTNDALRGSVSEAVSNLQRMVNLAVAKKATVIVATLIPITRSSSGAENKRAAASSSGIRKLNGARIAEVRAGFDTRDTADGIHPNNAGQAYIAGVIRGQF
jgi:lysophospholipase L1-like esterase